MIPKRKGIVEYAIPIILILFILIASLQGATAYDIAKKQPINNDYTAADGSLIEKRDFNYGLFFNTFLKRMEHPEKIVWGTSSMMFLIIAGIGCFVGVEYMISTKKKYITGKEYGSAEWGTAKQIHHLTNQPILKESIKEIKKENISKEEKNKKIRELKSKYSNNSNIIFTQTEKICMYNYELNNNTLIIGGSGSGKTRGYVLPNILQCTNSRYSPSLVITDPKGEILAKVGDYLKKNDYVIKVLNLKEQDRSFCFNPFKYIIEERYEEEIANIVRTIMSSRNSNSEQSKTNDPFWEDMASILLNAIFYAVYEGFEEKDKNMTTVMKLFRWFEVKENDNIEKNPTDLDKFFFLFGDIDGTYEISQKIISYYNVLVNINDEEYECIPEAKLDFRNIRKQIHIPIGTSASQGAELYINDMNRQIQELSQLDGFESLVNDGKSIIKEIKEYIEDRYTNYKGKEKPIGVRIYNKYGDENSNPALRSWQDFRTKCKGKTAQSVTSTALSKVAPFDEKQIRRIFEKDEMELDLIGERRTALFIVLPPTNVYYNFIANVLYTMLFEQLEYCATVKYNQQLPVPVRFILDEFYNTGRIPKFENILSYARSFGIGISIILQSLDQIKEMYEKSWGTIIDNCSTFLYLGGIRHVDTLEYICKLIGKGTFDKRTISENKGKSGSHSYSYDKVGRDLMDISELQKMDKKHCLLFVNGYDTYYSRKFNYKTHPNYKYTSDGNKKYLFKYKLPDEEKVELDINNGNRVVTHDIDNKSTHGEEKGIIVTPVQSEKVKIVANQKAVEQSLQYLAENVLMMETDEIEISDTEMEELRLRKELEDKEKKINEENIDKLIAIGRIASEKVKLTKEIPEVTNAMNNMLKENDVIFETPEDYKEEGYEEYEDDNMDSQVLMEELQMQMDDFEVSMTNLNEINSFQFNLVQEDIESERDEQ